MELVLEGCLGIGCGQGSQLCFIHITSRLCLCNSEAQSPEWLFFFYFGIEATPTGLWGHLWALSSGLTPVVFWGCVVVEISPGLPLAEPLAPAF